jgi:hypothetical protein
MTVEAIEMRTKLRRYMFRMLNKTMGNAFDLWCQMIEAGLYKLNAVDP